MRFGGAVWAMDEMVSDVPLTVYIPPIETFVLTQTPRIRGGIMTGFWNVSDTTRDRYDDISRGVSHNLRVRKI